MKRKQRFRLWGPLAVAFALASGATVAEAQELKAPGSRIEAVASADWVSFYRGDATVGGYSSWGFTGSLTLRTETLLGGELFFAFSPSHESPRTPRLLMPGGWATISLTRDPREGLDIFLALGAAYVNLSDWDRDLPCLPPGCFAEGGAGFNEGSSLSAVIGGGVVYRSSEVFSLRLDLRVPTKNDLLQESTPRIGFGVGYRVR